MNIDLYEFPETSQLITGYNAVDKLKQALTPGGVAGLSRLATEAERESYADLIRFEKKLVESKLVECRFIGALYEVPKLDYENDKIFLLPDIDIFKFKRLSLEDVFILCSTCWNKNWHKIEDQSSTFSVYDSILDDSICITEPRISGKMVNAFAKTDQKMIRLGYLSKEIVRLVENSHGKIRMTMRILQKFLTNDLKDKTDWEKLYNEENDRIYAKRGSLLAKKMSI